MNRTQKLKRIIELMVRKQLKESYYDPTELGTTISNIGIEILNKNKPDWKSGQELLRYKNEFIQAVQKAGITSISKEVFDDLEDNNEHTAIKILRSAGMIEENKKKLKESKIKFNDLESILDKNHTNNTYDINLLDKILKRISKSGTQKVFKGDSELNMFISDLTDDEFENFKDYLRQIDLQYMSKQNGSAIITYKDFNNY